MSLEISPFPYIPRYNNCKKLYWLNIENIQQRQTETDRQTQDLYMTFPVLLFPSQLTDEESNGQSFAM